MLRPFEDLSGSSLENWFKDLFLNYLAFSYYPSPGQIELNTLDPTAPRGQHLEIDGIILINHTCIFLEFTAQNDKFKEKIKKFTRNCNLFINSTHLDSKGKFSLFNVPDDILDNVDDIDNYKYLFIGTHSKFENQQLSRDNFPDYPSIKDQLFIFKPTHIEYLRQLTNLINRYASNEFLAALGFLPSELEEEESSLHLNFIKASGKYITTDDKCRADIYLVKFKVKDLLRMARVSRYEGIPFILNEDNNQNYQRFLIDQKLAKISDNFIHNNYRKSFPNTITLVLSPNCREDTINNESMLTIPNRYSSIDIIDGQHRLFAYTKANITDDVRNKSEILATAIKFKPSNTAEPSEITKFAAKVFCEINANQAKVKNNLIYLIKYDILGDVDETALAGKILLECNRSSGALGDIFFTNTLRKRNKLNLPAIPVTTIIDNDLVPFLKGLKITDQPIEESEYSRIFGNTKSYYHNSHQTDFIRHSRVLLERYFGYVSKVFKFDWAQDSNSYLISAKYISAFIRYLRLKMFEGETIATMEQVLKNLKTSVDSITCPNNSPSFPKGNLNIPSTKHGINTIYEFLKDVNSFSHT